MVSPTRGRGPARWRRHHERAPRSPRGGFGACPSVVTPGRRSFVPKGANALIGITGRRDRGFVGGDGGVQTLKNSGRPLTARGAAERPQGHRAVRGELGRDAFGSLCQTRLFDNL